jgi:hypothetical protein
LPAEKPVFVGSVPTGTDKEPNPVKVGQIVTLLEKYVKPPHLKFPAEILDHPQPAAQQELPPKRNGIDAFLDAVTASATAFLNAFKDTTPTDANGVRFNAAVHALPSTQEASEALRDAWRRAYPEVRRDFADLERRVALAQLVGRKVTLDDSEGTPHR